LTPAPAGICISSPVCGLRPVRAGRCTFCTLTKPWMVTVSPAAVFSVTSSTIAFSTASTSDGELPTRSATAWTSSFLFMGSPRCGWAAVRSGPAVW
jgi:hypothetical protein